MANVPARATGVRGEGIRMIIRDSSIVAMMWRDRPLALWGSTFEPRGQFRLDRLKVRFEDPDDHAQTDRSNF